jgi:2-polyprenyl-6-methoxyphenol hydroxylase-like FAD-dependent oxidoreductase
MHQPPKNGMLNKVVKTAPMMPTKPLCVTAFQACTAASSSANVPNDQMVSHTRALDAASLDEALADSPLLGRLCAVGTRSQTRLARNWSYANRVSHGPRFACVGDAACFLDPLFSSGVSLALFSAAETCDRLLPALRRQGEGDPELMRPFGELMQRGTATFAAMIDRFYHTRFADHFLFGGRRDEHVSRGIVSVLAGDVFRQGNAFQDMLLASRRNPWARAE